jgi:hypothetical protein
MDLNLILSSVFVVAFIGFLVWRAKKKRTSTPGNSTVFGGKKLPGDEDKDA